MSNEAERQRVQRQLSGVRLDQRILHNESKEAERSRESVYEEDRDRLKAMDRLDEKSRRLEKQLERLDG